MTLLEKKVDAIARSLLARDPKIRGTSLEQLRVLMEGRIPTRDVRHEIGALLADLGIPERIVGHRYLLEAVLLCVKDQKLIRNITKCLYPETAQICGSTASKVERGIRHAVELCFDRCDPETIREYFGNTVSPSKGKLTNSEFIARCMNIIRERIAGGVTRVLPNLSRLRSLPRPLRAL